MARRLQAWRVAADELWAAKPLPFAEAGRLLAEIRRAGDPQLRSAAEQALPSTRRAIERTPGPFERSVARKRFGAVRDALHTLTSTHFGRQKATRTARPPSPPISPEEIGSRQLLGVSTQGALTRADIQAAYKRSARVVHPDTGGDAERFYELTQARVALLDRWG